MPDTMARLAGPTALAAAAATVYTAPSSGVVTLTSIHVCNETAAAVTFTLSLGVDAAGRRVFRNVPVQPQDTFQWTGQLVMAASEALQAFAAAASSLTLTITGVVST